MFIKLTDRANHEVLVNVNNVLMIYEYSPDSYDAKKELPQSLISFNTNADLAVMESLNEIQEKINLEGK